MYENHLKKSMEDFHLIYCCMSFIVTIGRELLYIERLETHHPMLVLNIIYNYTSTCFTFFFIITASPTTPFPTIMECTNQTLGQSCNVTSSHDLSITCTVRYYYPRINVYFRHKSNILKSLTSAKWNNTDWTLNKNVTIVAVPSDSDIPGMAGHEQIATVYVNDPISESTSEDPMARITTQMGDHRESSIVRE